MWSISTILTGLYSFMIDDKPTTGSINTTNATKVTFAKDSLEYNVKNDKSFRALFPEYVQLWNEREERRKAKLAELGIADDTTTSKDGEKMVGSTREVNDVFAMRAGLLVATLLSILFAILRFV